MNNDWIYEKLFHKATAPERRLTRKEKKLLARLLKAYRQKLVYFAGHHLTAVHSKSDIDHHLLDVRFTHQSARPIPVPRSLRFSLGKTIGGKPQVTWKSMIGSSAFIYAAYASEPSHSTPEAEPL